MKFRIACCCIVALMVLTGQASAQWTADYQPTTDETYYAISFPTSTVGYIVGAGGIIYKTIDGGDTWVSQTSPTTDSFFAVYFSDANTGWAVGDNGVIAVTSDGTNWSLHPQSGLVTGNDLNSVFFIGSSVWIGGDDDVVWYSIDGGTSFNAPTVNPAADDINSIKFVDALNGYAAADGNGVIYTTDGGVNWTSASVNLGPYPYTRTDIEVVYTIDDTTAVASGWGSSAAGLQPTIILVSTDAGVSWATPDPTYPWAVYAYGYGIAVFDDGDVVVMGGGTNSASPVIHSSGDYSSWAMSDPFFGDDIRGCAAVPGTDRVVAVGDGGFIATSDDKGYNWSYYFDPNFGFNGVLKFAAAGEKLYAVGAGGAFMKRDGSGNWTYDVASAEFWAPDIEDVAVLPAASGGNVIYVCGKQAYLAKSTDDGATWTLLYHVATAFDAFYGMHWFDELNGVIVGEKNRDDVVLLTSDGGQSFNEVWWNVKSEQINSISFAPDNPSVGVFVTDNIAVYYTTDGGANWTAGTTDVVSTTDDFEEVHMVNATTGWAVGDAGTLVKTTDGGATWTQQTAFSSLTLTDVYFNNPGFGWISGDDGLVYYTDDAGASWNDISSAISLNDVRSIYLNGTTGELFAGCEYTLIQTRDDDAVTDADSPGIPFVLGQNYPNPFNPSTTIRFSISEKGFVALNIYDVTGRRVAEMLNREMGAGEHTVSFQADGLASGVYFYRLETNDEVQTKKMILLR